MINPGSRIGTCAIVNTGAIVEHDCEVGDFAHVSPGTVLCGEVRVGKDAHGGAGSVVRQQIEIGDLTVIEIGNAVVKSIPPNTTTLETLAG